MTFTRYLVDTVTLSRLTPDERGSVFMRKWCRIPEEVLFEARGLPGIDALKGLTYSITPDVLRQAKFVLATIRPGDKVIDLYQNEGNGDVFLLATALAEMAISETQLIGDTWVIATADKGLTRKALELGVTTCSLDEFRQLL